MIEVKQLRESISKALKEFYEVPLDESINMELVYFGKHDGLDRYELDGIEFFVGEDEDLQNAIETCIDEEFMPEWKENSDAVDFSIDSVDFIEGKDEKGFVGITVFGEDADLDESLNEAKEITLFSELKEWGLEITLKVTKDGFQVVSDLRGEKDTMSDVCPTWQEAIDQCMEECEDDISFDLVIAIKHIADNKYGQYFKKKLGEIEDLDESLNESVSTENIEEALLNAIKEYNHEDSDLMEYVVVECTEKEDGQIVAEVRDELSYEGMVKLAERLDRVVRQFDPQAYFDQECPGIMTAYINLKK